MESCLNMVIAVGGTFNPKSSKQSVKTSFIFSLICHVELSCIIMSHVILVIRKLDFCLCEHKAADQLCSNCTVDQRLLFSLHRKYNFSFTEIFSSF